MLTQQQLLEIAQAAVEGAMKAGAEWADAACAWSYGSSVEAEKNSIRTGSYGETVCVGVRAFYRGGMGMAQRNALQPDGGRDAAFRAGQQAAEMARASSPDPDFKRLPDPKPVQQVEGLSDPKVAELSTSAVVEWLSAAIDEARQVHDGALVSGYAGFGVAAGALASSTGVALSVQTSSLGLSVQVTVWEGEEAASYGDGISARRLDDFAAEGLATRVAKRAVELLHEKPVPTGRMDIVLDFQPARAFVCAVLGAADAEAVQRNRSFLVGREGERIASPVLHVVEKPFEPGGIDSGGWDGEGVPKAERALIDSGVLTTYLHNSYTAGKAGVEPTGHAARGGCSPSVGIGFSNLHIKTGSKTRDQLISEVERGIFLVSGAPLPNPVTGEVTTPIMGGFVIENGQLGAPVKSAIVSGHIFELLERLDAVSSDARRDPGWVVPAIRIRDVLISAR